MRGVAYGYAHLFLYNFSRGFKADIDRENNCAIMYITTSCRKLCLQNIVFRNGSEQMITIEIDFQSDEAIYVQLRNQIILGIATSVIQEGDALPSVRQLAEDIGINMHTVNKAYSVLRQEGFLRLDRRKGAVIALDTDKMQAIDETKSALRVLLTKACCKDISVDEVHEMVDEIYNDMTNGRM